MKIKIAYKIFLTIVLLSFFEKAESQSDIGLYGLRVIPQSNFQNPAFIPEGETFIGIPLISSISNSTYSSSFSFNDIFIEKEGSDSLYLNLNSLATNNTNNNYVTEYFENDIIYLGFKIKKKHYLNIGIRNRLYSRAIYSTDLVKLLWNGNANHIGQQLNMSNTFINHDHFVSYYLGFGFTIGKNINLGIRANLNQGLSSIQTTDNQIILETIPHNKNVYSINANSTFTVNTSGLPTDSAKSEIAVNEYLFNFQNIGFSVDFGADVKVSDRINLSFSINDLGFINWKSELKTYESTSDSIQFSGIYADISTTEDIFAAYGDSLAQLIDINEFEQDFQTKLPARIFAGIEYYGLDRSNRFSAVFSGTFLKNNFSPAFSVGYDKTVSKHFTFKVTYSYLKYAPVNFGAGLVLNIKPVQIYLLTDNIVSAFYWSGQKYINFRFGINLIFPENLGTKKSESVLK